MPPIITNSIAPSHLLTSETRPRMAKADLRKPETDAWRTLVGQAIERVKERCGLSLKEFADVIGRDERQVARWFNGAEHAQLAPIFAVERLRQPLIIVLAELAGERVEITTVITLHRIA